MTEGVEVTGFMWGRGEGGGGERGGAVSRQMSVRFVFSRIVIVEV